MGTNRFYFGIDPGIVCGLALWDAQEQKFISVEGVKLHQLFSQLDLYAPVYPITVRIEDPTTWHPFRGSDPHENSMRIQGAGALKQTFKHIIEYLEDRNIEHTKIKLTGVRKKVKAPEFKALTKHQGSTNEHGRDAAMLVFGFK